MNSSAVLSERALLAVSGADARNFLQGLITNDIGKLAPDAALYAALLTPQGKILFDFLLYEHDQAILLDCSASAAEPLRQRLAMYKLRAKVEIGTRDDLAVLATWNGENIPPGARRDPRLSALGWRALAQKSSLDPAAHPSSAYLVRRLALGVPEGRDFGSNAMFALDADLDELHAVAFDKGCYVGQELTARMKHKGTARKRLLPVETDSGALPAAESAVMADGRELGTLLSVYGDRGFALIRLDRLDEAAGAALVAEGIPVRVSRPAWLFP